MAIRGKETKAITPERNPVHFSRLMRSRLGAKPSDIAAADGVSEEVVVGSIKNAQLYCELHSLDFTNIQVLRTIGDVMPETGLAIKRGLRARKTVGAGKRSRSVDDIAAQQKTVANVVKLVETMQPKANMNISASANAGASAQTANFNEAAYQPGFEELIDGISANVQSHNQLPREVGTTNDDVILVEDEEDEDSAERESVTGRSDGDESPPVETSP